MKAKIIDLLKLEHIPNTAHVFIGGEDTGLNLANMSERCPESEFYYWYEQSNFTLYLRSIKQ